MLEHCDSNDIHADRHERNERELPKIRHPAIKENILVGKNQGSNRIQAYGETKSFRNLRDGIDDWRNKNL